MSSYVLFVGLTCLSAGIALGVLLGAEAYKRHLTRHVLDVVLKQRPQ